MQSDDTSSPRRMTTVQTLRGVNARGSPHPFRANRGDISGHGHGHGGGGGGGQRSRSHTPDDLLNVVDGSAMGPTAFARPQSIHDVQHLSNSG